jgi:hypothetical protein
MKLRYTPFMEMILAYGFLGLGLAAGPATVWAVVAVLESGKRVHGDHLLFTVGWPGKGIRSHGLLYQERFEKFSEVSFQQKPRFKRPRPRRYSKEKIRKSIPLLLETSQKIPPRLDFRNCLLAGNFFQRALVKQSRDRRLARKAVISNSQETSTSDARR